MGGREHQTSLSHAPEKEAVYKQLSPHEDATLPGKNQNKDNTIENNAHVSFPKDGSRDRDLNSKEAPEKSQKMNNDNCNKSSGDPTTQSRSPPTEEGDNREEGEEGDNSLENHEKNSSKSKTGEPWHEAFLSELKATSTEMKAIRTRMEKLDSIEAATSQLTTQISAVMGKTTVLETKVEEHDSQFKEMKEEIKSLKTRVEQQDKKIEELSQLKTDYKKATRKAIGEMNELIQVQKDQVDSFHETSERVKKDILIEVDDRIEELSEDVNHNKLKNQAYRNRQNIVITGLVEEENISPKKAASDFIKETLKIKDIEIEEAYRIGTPPSEGSSYCRPIVVCFAKLTHRKKVWKNRINITADNDNHQIRIQADLPKKLREEVRVLYSVTKAAAASQKYKSAVVRDYAIVWEGREYRPSQLELLPRPLRPSTLATKKSDQALVFFSRHSILSNHHPSVFKWQGHTYQTMEHYLAHKRASLSNQKHLARKALKSKNPAEAKAILNSLKDEHAEEWDKNVEEWATEGIRAKFAQNQGLANFLCNTGKLHLGEASRNERWGVGMDLNNDQVLDFANWPNNSNLLGKILMKIRQEILESRANKN